MSRIDSLPSLPPAPGGVGETQPLPGPQGGNPLQDAGLSVGFASTNAEGNADLSGALALLDKPTMSGDDVLALLMALQAKLGNEGSKSATEGVKANAEKQKVARAEQAKKLEQAAAELAKARASGLIGQIFGWIGAAFAIIAAVAVTVATFGAAAPASGLAIAGVIAALTGAVLAGTTQIVGAIPGALEKMGKEGSQAFMFSMMALQIACAIFSIGAGFGSAANVAKSGADSAKQVADLGVKAGRLEMAAEKVGKAAETVEGATVAAQVGADIAAADQTHKAEYSKADAALVAKWLKSLAAMDEAAIDFVKALYQIEEKGWGIVADTSKEQAELDQTIAAGFLGPSA